MNEKETWTIGIDEAGRGPLAGPVSVGVFAVSNVFDTSALEGIRDSKKCMGYTVSNNGACSFCCFLHTLRRY
jgi:ribonuclease HIII